MTAPRAIAASTADRYPDAVTLMRYEIGCSSACNGTVECAECGAQAKWARASDGSIWCACPTPECVRWIE